MTLANSSRAPASWGPKALNGLAPPGLGTSSQAVAAPAAAPPLRAAAQRRLGPLHAAPRIPEESQPRPPQPGSVTCVARRPASSALSSSLARSHGRTPTPSAAASPRSGGDRPDKPRLACERPGPPAHTLHPAPPAVGWRFPEASGGGSPDEAAAYWLVAPSLGFSSDFRPARPFPVRFVRWMW